MLHKTASKILAIDFFKVVPEKAIMVNWTLSDIGPQEK